MHRIRSILFVAAFATLASAASAYAHVTANPPQQAAGSQTVVNFRVPVEKGVPVVALAIQVPDGVTGIAIEPVPGWTGTLKKVKLAKPFTNDDGETITDRVTEIDYAGGSLKPGEFQDFPVAMKLPASGQVGDMVIFPAVQTYADKSVVSWIQKPAQAGADTTTLDHPAPTVTLTHDSGTSTASAGTSTTGPAPGAESAKADAHDTGDETDWAAIAGIALGAIALVVGLVAMRRRRP